MSYDGALRDALTQKLGVLAERWLCAGIIEKIAVVFFALIVLGTVSLAYFNPVYNWDLAPYVGVAIEDRYDTAEELHAASWGEVRKTATDLQFYKMTRSIPYRVNQYENPEHFVSLFPLYRVKVGYVETIRFLDNFVSPVQATVLISTFAAILVGAFMIYWAVREGFAQGLLVAGPLALIAGYLFSAREATPDLLMAVFTLPGVYLASKGRPLMASPFFLAMFLVRPDGILLLFALGLAALVAGRHRLIYLAMFLATLALYGPLTAGADHPGWWPHFYFTNVEYQDDMRGFDPAFSVAVYLKALVVNTVRAFQWFTWPMLLALLLLGWWLLFLRGRRIATDQFTVLLAITLCIGGKFVTFPLPDNRVYLVYILPMIMVLMEIWKPDFSFRRVRAHAAEA